MSDAVVLSRVSGGAIDGRLQFVRVRQRLFHSLHRAITSHRGPLLQAIQADDVCTKAEAQAVFASALVELRRHYDLLDFKQDLDSEYSLAKNKSNESKRRPITLAYIIPYSVNLFYNVVSALSAALEAGSCVVVEVCSLSCWSSLATRLNGPRDDRS
jgi:aldehyde dehydrogenase (NAD+)